MVINVNDIPVLKDDEENRARRIAHFLIKNFGKAYTIDEIENTTRLICAGQLLRYSQKEYLKSLGIAEVDIMVLHADTYCGSREHYYYEGKPEPEPKRKWWQFWK